MPGGEPSPIEVHKALADDTRFRLYRYLRLSGRPVSVRELSTRLSLHPNTLRPHLRRLEEAGLVRSETRKGPAGVGRPQTLYAAVDRDGREGRAPTLIDEDDLVENSRVNSSLVPQAQSNSPYVPIQASWHYETAVNAFKEV